MNDYKVYVLYAFDPEGEQEVQVYRHADDAKLAGQRVADRFVKERGEQLVTLKWNRYSPFFLLTAETYHSLDAIFEDEDDKAIHLRIKECEIVESVAAVTPE
jgi:hypothetical protein